MPFVKISLLALLLAGGSEELNFPARYREWIYLSSGFDMSYNPKAKASGHPVFDNVFVNPEAYAAFVATGTWPDQTTLVLEVRGAEGKGSINSNGHYQGAPVMGLEVHAKAAGQWSFYSFDKQEKARRIASTADCYSCHQQHGAVDTTFVQFYPTLSGIARGKRTFRQE